MPGLAFAFAAPVLRAEDGMTVHYLPLPADVADALDAAGVRRLVGTMNGAPVSRGIIRNRHGERFLYLSRDLLRALRADVGDLVEVEVRPDPAPLQIDLGEELAAALEQDDEAAARWATFTPGRQRSMASYVTSAKREETRIKRALELAHRLRTYTLYGDLHPEKR